jgi:DUF1680 family protein
MKCYLLLPLVMVTGAGLSLADPLPGRLTAVPFTAVKLADAFFAPRIETNRVKSLPHNFKWCEDTGRISNFAKAAGLMPGQFLGIYFNDSDVYKVLEGAAYSLAAHPDPVLDKTADAVIAKIAAAQQANGYLNTYFTLVEPQNRWKDFRSKHELYCAGHLFEAAVAHYRATGRRTFLDVAVKLADHIDATFGPGKRLEVPGHEEIELALIKLAAVTGQERYRKLAQFFVDIRGDAARRKIHGAYCQDHLPVRQQSEIVGHAVRAMYLYAGVADVAADTGDKALVAAMERLWQDVAERKMYITGGIGARHQGEAFGDAYELPNPSAYCETCAAIGLAFWNHRLNLLHADAKYADVLERAIYNGILSGVALDGEHFFYVNPLASSGGHHRQPFFGCACCPTNMARFLPSLPGYVYATAERTIYVNLYATGTAGVDLQGAKIKLAQETRYPWEGRVTIRVQPEKPTRFALAVRIPGWCRKYTVSVAGREQGWACKNGYAVADRNWLPGDTVELNLDMPVERIEAHPRVEADRGRVAIQRGPIVYCLEGVDNPAGVRSMLLAKDPQFRCEHRADLLGGVTVIHAVDRAGRPLTAIPYYAWDHRQAGPMLVWINQDGKNRQPAVDDPTWTGHLYRPLDPATLGSSTELTLVEQIRVSASHAHAQDSAEAVCDEIEPHDSCDHSIPRFTWWNHRGTKEWIQYEFDKPQRLSAAAVYWFDDERMKRQCRVPAAWRLVYRDGNAWKPVAAAGPYGVAKDKYNRVRFAPITTNGLRVEVELQKPYSGGILEWKLEP